jgi:hypothetical protein
MTEHAHGPDCKHEPKPETARQRRMMRCAMHERIWDGKALRRRQPYPRTPVVPLHLLGVVELIVPSDAPVPTKEQIDEARKEHKRRRNARRRMRP